MAEVSVAIVGCGQWGLNHVRTFAQLAQCRVSWLVDADPVSRSLAGRIAPGAATANDLKTALKDDRLQACIIATGAKSHHLLCRQALEAGRHVLVEKPMALNLREAEELVNVAEGKGVVLMVGHLLIYHPAVNYLKGLLDQGGLGQVLYLYSLRLNLNTVHRQENVLWTLAPHDISIMLHLLGQGPIGASAKGRCFLQKDIEDVVFFTLDFPGGQVAQVHVSWLDPHKVRRLTVVGTKRMATFDDMEATEKIRIYNRGVDQEINYQSFDEVLSLRLGDISIPYFKMTEPLRLEAGHFLDCITSGKRPLSDGIQGLEVVRILEAVEASLRTGRPQRI